MDNMLFEIAPPVPPSANHAIFFAAVPPEEIKDEIAAAWQIAGTSDRFRRRTLHMSILDVMNTKTVDESLLFSLQNNIANLSLNQFTVVFDRIMAFGGGAIVLGTADASTEANTLAADLQRQLVRNGIKPKGSVKVTPHVTMAYGARFPETRMLRAPVHWTVTDLVLIDSLFGQGRHVPLARWPLRAPPA